MATQNNIYTSGSYLQPGLVRPTGGTSGDDKTLGDMLKKSNQLVVPSGASITFPDGTYTVAKSSPISIVSRSVTTPPDTPVTGDIYIVPDNSSTAWGFPDASMLQWSGTAWTLLTPIAGAQVRATDESIYITYEGGVWVQTSVPVDQGVDGDALAAVHGNDDSHAISQISGLQAALDAAGAPSATNNEIIAGMVTDTRTVSPAQVKLSVQTFGPVAATDGEMSAGTETTTRTISPKQVKDTVTALIPVTSVASRTGAITLTLDDAADSSASSGRLAITTAEAAKLRSVAAGSIAGRKAADGTGALTILTAAEAVAELPVATTGAKGLLPAADKSKLDGLIPINEVLIGTFTTGNTVLTLTDMPAAVKNPASTAIIPLEVSLYGVTKIKLRGKISTAGATGARVAVKFCVNTTSSTWIMSNGDAEPANNSTAPDSTTATNWDAWLIDSTASAIIDQEVDVPSACQSVTGLSRLWLVLWGGDGTTDPVLANLRVYIPTGATIGVASATDGEIAAGTVTDTRTVSPKQIKDAVLAFAPAGVAAASDGEIAAGTVTSTRTVSPKQIKDAVTTFAPAETAATNTDITTGSSTTPMVLSPAQAKLAAQTWGSSPSFTSGTIGGRTTAGTGAIESLSPATVQGMLAMPSDTATAISYTRYNGIVDTTLQTIGYVQGTRTFTITRVSNYDVWVGGTKLTITTDKTVVNANTTGTYYIYFNSSGNLVASTTKWGFNGANAPVAVVEYNVNGGLGVVVDCRFPYRKSFYEWEFQSRQIGAWIDNGYAMTFGSTDGSFSLAAGRHVVNGYGYTVASPITTAAIFRRRQELSWNQNLSASSDIRLIYGTSLGYDNGGLQANVTIGYYTNIFLFICDGIVYSVAGQAQYATQADAEAVTIDSMQLPGFLKVAGRALARVTYQRTSGQPGTFISYGDLRNSRIVDGVTLGGGGGGTTIITGGGGGGTTVFTVDPYIAGKPAAGAVVYRKPMNQACKLLGSGLGHAASSRVATTGGATFLVTKETWSGTDFSSITIASITFSPGSGAKVAAITSTETTFATNDVVQITAPSTQDATLADIGASLIFALV